MLSMNYKRISDAQYAFLRDVRDGNMTLGELKSKHKVEEKRFSRWLRGRGFRRALWKILRESKNRRRVELQLAANVGAEMLAQAVRQEITLTADQLLVLEKVENATVKEEQQRRAEQRSRGCGGRMKKRLPSEDDDLCHPNAKGREDELLAILQSRDNGGGGERG